MAKSTAEHCGSGIGQQHFPEDLRFVFDLARTKTGAEIRSIIGANPGGAVARTHQAAREFSDAEALNLARQTKLNLVAEILQIVDEPTTAPSDRRLTEPAPPGGC